MAKATPTKKKPLVSSRILPLAQLLIQPAPLFLRTKKGGGAFAALGPTLGESRLERSSFVRVFWNNTKGHAEVVPQIEVPRREWLTHLNPRRCLDGSTLDECSKERSDG
jgi:hypothetical protein